MKTEMFFKHLFSSIDDENRNPSQTLHDFYRQQLSSWKVFANNCQALSAVRKRTLKIAGRCVNIQYNPLRLENITATGGAERGCFLCGQNLHKEQLGIIFADGAFVPHSQAIKQSTEPLRETASSNEFIVLCNPNPIFYEHFTIAHRWHIEQTLLPHIQAFLLLTKHISPDFRVFFNGALSGASIPSHLHFQAIPQGVLPIEAAPFIDIGSFGTLSIALLDDPVRTALRLASDSQKDIASFMAQLIGQLPGSNDTRLNVFAAFTGSSWSLIVFFRSRQRPERYYAPVPENLLISPGCVEMGGQIITARESDFLALTDEIITEIYRDVSLEAQVFKALLDNTLSYLG